MAGLHTFRVFKPISRENQAGLKVFRRGSGYFPIKNAPS
jgi:hypothetical protein